MYIRPNKIISGGQTGADQAGLFAAAKCGIETGGFAPSKYMTEIGPAPWLANYGLVELKGHYPERTRKNLEICDGVVIFSKNLKSPGTKLTVKIAQELNIPCMTNPHDGNFLYLFCILNQISILNVAGNRESKAPGIFDHALEILVEAFTVCAKDVEQ